MMTGYEIAAVVNSLALLYNIVISAKARKASEKSVQQLDVALGKIEQVHDATNGLTAKLITASSAAAGAEGRAEGLQQGRDEAHANETKTHV